MLAQLVSVALTASVKATDTKSVSSFNHFLKGILSSRYMDNLGLNPEGNIHKMIV